MIPLMAMGAQMMGNKKKKEEAAEAAKEKQKSMSDAAVKQSAGAEVQAVTTGNDKSVGGSLGSKLKGPAKAVVGAIDAQRKKRNEQVADHMTMGNKRQVAMQKAQGNITSLMSTLKGFR